MAAEPVELAPDAVRIADSSHRVFETKVMKSGRLQVQDVGSQLIAEVCRPPGGSLEGRIVADVCAGAGGKTLALADMVGASGRVLAGDRSRRRLAQARERVRELSVRNVAFPHPLPLSEAEVLLVDAPCSGTGSLGREPDQKWKLNPKAITDFQSTQLALLEEVAKEARPGSLIVYATCSLLPEENDEVVRGFLAKHAGLHPGAGGRGAGAGAGGGALRRALPEADPTPGAGRRLLRGAAAQGPGLTVPDGTRYARWLSALAGVARLGRCKAAVPDRCDAADSAGVPVGTVAAGPAARGRARTRPSWRG